MRFDDFDDWLNEMWEEAWDEFVDWWTGANNPDNYDDDDFSG